MSKYFDKNELWFNKKSKANDPNNFSGQEYAWSNTSGTTPINVPYNTSTVTGLYNSQQTMQNQKAAQSAIANGQVLQYNGASYYGYNSNVNSGFNSYGRWYDAQTESRAKPIIEYMTKILSLSSI